MLRLLPFLLAAACDIPRDCDVGVCGVAQECGTFGLDGDGDGFAAIHDCNDSNCAVHPAATETCDWIDNDCDGAADFDFEMDIEDALPAYLGSDEDGVCRKETASVCMSLLDGVNTSLSTVEGGLSTTHALCIPPPWLTSEMRHEVMREYGTELDAYYGSYLLIGNEDAFLGPDADSYWDDCDTGDEPTCDVRNPQCQYSEPVSYDEDGYPTFSVEVNRTCDANYG